MGGVVIGEREREISHTATPPEFLDSFSPGFNERGGG